MLKRLGLLTVLVFAFALVVPAESAPSPPDTLEITDILLEAVDADAACADAVFTFSLSATGAVNDRIVDGNEHDDFVITVEDGNGTPIIGFQTSARVGMTFPKVLPLDSSIYINPIAARPLTLKIHDTAFDEEVNPPTNLGLGVFNAAHASGAPLLMIMTIDPADYVDDCANLPMAAPPDGRINPDLAASAVAYPWQGGGVVFYSPAGVLLLAVTPEQIEAVGCPEVNTLVAEGNGVQLYRLSSCEFQMVAPTLDGTKNYNVLMTPALALIRTFEE